VRRRGYSTVRPQAAMTKILEETLPKGMGSKWSELDYQQILSGNTALFVFPDLRAARLSWLGAV